MSWQLSGNNYKYQTKEMQKYFDYNVLDFGARHYDPNIARWTVPDPAGQYFNLYYAMGGNPVSYWAALQNGELISVSGITYPEVVSTRIGVLMSESDDQKTGSYCDGVFWYSKYQDESNAQYTAFREGGDIAANAAMLLVPVEGLGLVAS